MSRLERKNSFFKKLAILVVFNMVFEIVAPTVSMALTSGPSSPEFGSFEPVATNNMVDPFTGDFTYNLPVLMVPGTNGGGYPISLSYHSGTTGEQEASWVGHGWSLNPGAINRGKQGFPDDWNGEAVRNHNKSIPSVTVTVGASVGAEIFSNNSNSIALGASSNASIVYNNYKGFGYSISNGLSLNKGLISTGYNIADGQSSFSLRVNPWRLIGRSKKRVEKLERKAYDNLDRYMAGKISDEKMDKFLKKDQRNWDKFRDGQNRLQFGSGVYGIISLSGGQKPNQINQYKGGAANFSFTNFVPPTWLQAGLEIGFTGSVAIQNNVPITTNSAFGNYYSSEAYANADNLMDYYTEKEHPYENNDVFLGIPHALTDQYMVTGEGIAGAFRMHHKRMGQYRPNHVKSEIGIGNLGFEFAAGLNTDFGMDGGAGYHVYRQKDWELYNGVEQYSGEDEAVFRFTNDLGGLVEFDNDATAESALVHKNNGVPGFKKYTPNTQYIDQEVNTNLENDLDYGIGASSYIGHNTFAQKNLTAGVVHYKAYEKSDHIEEFVDYNELKIQDQIAEVSVKNKVGERYNYGLPVFAREEKEISIGLTGVSPQPLVENGYLTYTDADISTEQKREKLKIIQGQERNAPYVTSYLLTSIEEPNYIDRTNDGPTEDDFGGYTKFNYKRAHGALHKENLANGDQWYQWRFPYTGLYYDRGRLSDRKDDMGSYSSGEKEVYYLEEIETKTHVAVFVTSDRMDGLSAKDNVTEASKYETSKGSQRLQKLDKIELFVKDEAWELYVADPVANPKPAPLKTVNFEYDYSLVPGIPNSDNNEGKLTLKRVWFDYNGIYKAQISPYEFEYNYPDYTNYPAKYNAGGADDVTAGYQNFNGAVTEVENPAYDEQQLNAWGYNQGTLVGQQAHDDMKTWVDQTLKNGENIPTGVGDQPYDPAAWNLKVIKLPSGGEIHVQYEQDDYQYVQDKVAHVMVPLLSELEGSQDENSPRYYLNTAAIDVTTDLEKQALADAIQKTYVGTGKKIYFKMLYSMAPSNTNPQITDCNAEYITGYVKVADAKFETWSGKVYIDLETGQYGRTDLPKKVCQEYEKAFLSGKPQIADCGINEGLALDENTDDKGEKVQQFLNLLQDMSAPGTSTGCADLSWEDSYFRVPCIKPKKGGGLRVKRLMMYTPSIHAGEEAELYGTEYVYQFLDADGKIKSSGVATNEPTSMREENILVDNIYRLPKNEWDKLRDIITAGKEKEKFEGPIGESLYGSASVGYSQVITKNIHSGQTNTGYGVNQFYTCKDFPLVADYTDLAGNTKNDYLPIPALYVNQTTNNVWAAQGYHFTINNMHGQVKRLAAYTGDYSSVTDLSTGNLVSATEYDYFKVGEAVPVMNSLEEIVHLPLGKESEMYMESRSVTDHLHDVSVETDFSVGLFGAIPIPMGSLFPSYTHVETELHTHVTNKITRYPAMVRSVRNYTDGIWSKTQHLAFNPQTGDPLITRTYDDFNESNEAEQFEIDNSDHHGWLTSYSIPAYQEYANMGQVALSEGKLFGSDAITSGSGYMIDKFVDPISNNVTLSFYSATGPLDVCDALSQLNTGDLINMPGGQFHIAAINGSEMEVVPTYYNTNTQYSATDISFLVLRSGRTNQAGATVGSFVTYGKPLTLDAILPTINYLAINDPSHPNYAAYLDRVTVMNMLNDMLAGGGGADIIEPGIIHLIGSGHCATENTEIYMNIVGGTISILLDVEGYGECDMNLTEIEGAEFQIDPESGALFYGTLGSGCNPQYTDCIVFCESLYPIKTVDNVIMAKAITLSDAWDYDVTAYDNGITDYNLFELGKRGKWRVKSSYAYKAATTGLEQRFNPFTSATSDQEFNYNSGLFTLALFNWKHVDANDPKTWLKATTVTKYDPNGNALEEQNILGIKSAVKFGYHEYLPYLTASNAPHGSVVFESFENTYTGPLGIVVEENTPVLAGTTVLDEMSHTGYSSLKFASGSTAAFFTTNEMEFTSQIATAGLHTKLWIKNLDESSEDIQVTIKDAAGPTQLQGDLNKVAQTGEWTLYELDYADWGSFNPETFTISFNIENSVAGKDFYVDDIRIQPLDAEMVCYVYDYKNYRLMATFDDQHFSMRYQYNDEGQLIRKQIETTRGIKTVTDGQYNTPLKNRTN